ncbi:MAG: hypothetical protein H6823_26855 [Planctomycetaceae bacterium]|nr:hypothetical protein [Planctomycetaceae bacterium]
MFRLLAQIAELALLPKGDGKSSCGYRLHAQFEVRISRRSGLLVRVVKQQLVGKDDGADGSVNGEVRKTSSHCFGSRLRAGCGAGRIPANDDRRRTHRSADCLSKRTLS